MGWWLGRVFYNCVSPKGRLAQQSVEFLPQLCSIFSNDNISVTSKLTDGLNTTVMDTSIIVDDFDNIITTTPSSLPPVSLGGSPAFNIHRTTTKIQKTFLDQTQNRNHRGLKHLFHLATSACGAAAASLSNKIMHAAASDVIHPTTDSDNTTTDSNNIEHEQVSSMFTADPAVDAINFVTTMPDWPHQLSKPTSTSRSTCDTVRPGHVSPRRRMANTCRRHKQATTVMELRARHGSRHTLFRRPCSDNCSPPPSPRFEP